LGDPPQLVPARRSLHFPSQQIDSGGQTYSRAVEERSGELEQWPGQWIVFMKVRKLFVSFVHIEKRPGVDGRAEQQNGVAIFSGRQNGARPSVGCGALSVGW
jgi:hypothetical protein